jgi:hypothetical protein
VWCFAGNSAGRVAVTPSICLCPDSTPSVAWH